MKMMSKPLTPKELGEIEIAMVKDTITKEEMSQLIASHRLLEIELKVKKKCLEDVIKNW